MIEINWQYVNITISIVTSVGSVLMAVYAWRHRDAQGARWLVALMAAVAWVTLWYAFEAASGADLTAYVTFTKFEYIGLQFLPMLWFRFALTFSGRERTLSTPLRVLLVLVPVITIVLAFTNEWHGLIYKEPRFDMSGQVPVYSPVYGTWFWLSSVFSYVIFLVGSVALMRRALGVWKLYRAQAVLLFAGTALPWISNVLIIFDQLNPLPYLYLNAVFLGAAMLCFMFAVFRMRLLDIMPTAYDTIFNNVPDGLMVVDLQDRIVALNEYCRPFLDNPKLDPLGLPLESAFSRYTKSFQALRNTFDYKGQLPIGNLVVEIRISPVVSRSGQRRGRLFVFRDVTARVQMEQAQRDEQQFAETMRDISSRLNSTLDTNRVLGLILDSVQQLVPGCRVHILLADGDTMRVRQHRGYDGDDGSRLDSMSFDYHAYPMLSASAPVIVPDTAQATSWKALAEMEDIRSFASLPLQGDGDLIGFINLDSAMPGMLKPEMVNRLQLFAHQAAAAIKNARLYEQTRRQSEELEILYGRVSRLEQLKSDMIRIAAHDLKNPLGVILSYLEFLNMPNVQVDQAQMYEAMKRAGDRMNQIIHDFLSLDRITQVAEQKTIQPFDLRGVVSTAAEEFARRAEDRSQKLSVSVPDTTCMVHADSAQIYEAIANFVGNAIKYTPESGRISVTLSQADGCARLEVTDTGHGIAEEQQAKLFSPFFRVETSETQDIEGSGLGLYLAKNIIERQGGTLIFRSAPGQGSTFGFQLPLYDTAQAEASEPPDLFAGVP